MFMPTTIKSRGYYATSREDGRWLVKGRGLRRVMSYEEMHAIFNPPPRKPKAAKPEAK
jgi:hypothetical protein